MTREATSEEKLLKLIRQKKKPGHFDSGQNDHARKKRINPLKRISFLFFFLSFGCVVYIAFNYNLIGQKEDTSSNIGMEVPRVDRITKKVSLPESKPFRFYEQRLQQRDLFEIPGMKLKLKSNILDNIGADLSKRIKIVGIVIDKDSKVIIEDVKTGKTFFLSEGERIGSAIIEKIQDDRVIFNYNNKKVELSP